MEKMKVTVTANINGAIKVFSYEDIEKIETLMTKIDSGFLQEVRFYTTPFTWHSFNKSGIVNIFIQ